VGSALANLLAEDGQEVIVVTRSGSGPNHKNIRRIAADASNVCPRLVPRKSITD
jgi:nucleoside-diphosphate-sugar epimerase